MTAPKDLLKIGDFARRAGTNLRTLRYYEDLGLLQPTRRGQGGFRYYRQSDLQRFQSIRVLQDLGLQLTRIGELLDTRGDREGAAGREEFMQRVEAALREEDRLVVERMAELEAQRRNIESGLQKLAECRPCLHTPSSANDYCATCITSGQALPDSLRALF